MYFIFFFLVNGLQFGCKCFINYVDINDHKSLLAGVFLSSEPPNSTSSSPSLGATPVCPHCCQWLQPDNHQIRLRPKPRPSPCEQSILRRNARGKHLSLVQRNVLRRFQTASSALVRQHHTSAASVSAYRPPTHTHTPITSFYLIIYGLVVGSRAVKIYHPFTSFSFILPLK